MTPSFIEELVEAIALWQLEAPGSMGGLTKAATNLLAGGAESEALIEVASLYSNERRSFVEPLVERLIDELDLHSRLSRGLHEVVSRAECRDVMSGRATERDFAKWVHSQFSHNSTSDLLQEAAAIDDDYDVLESRGDYAGAGADRQRLDLRLREIAAEIISR